MTNFIKLLNNLRLLLLLIIVEFLNPVPSDAANIAGGFLSYEPVGNNTYIVTFNLITECSSGVIPANENLNVVSSCMSQLVYTMSTTGPQDTIKWCYWRKSTCEGGNLPGFISTKYRAVVTLLPCEDWIMSVDECCMMSTITTIENPSTSGIHLEAGLNNLNLDNRSMVFTSYNGGLADINTGINLGNDWEFDSILIQFMSPLISSNTSVSYKPGYSVLNPVTMFSGLSIDSLTNIYYYTRSIRQKQDSALSRFPNFATTH
jgi:hypothetical protein